MDDRKTGHTFVVRASRTPFVPSLNNIKTRGEMTLFTIYPTVANDLFFSRHYQGQNIIPIKEIDPDIDYSSVHCSPKTTTKNMSVNHIVVLGDKFIKVIVYSQSYIHLSVAVSTH